jgi:tetratricopeptide (TPR) repeat protein
VCDAVVLPFVGSQDRDLGCKVDRSTAASRRIVKPDAAREAGDLVSAEEHSRAALSLYIMTEDSYSAARTLISLAEIRYLMGDYTGAIDLNTQAAERLPGDNAALTDLAYAEWRAGSAADAEVTFSQVLHWDSDIAPALAGRGQVRAELGNYASALDDLDRALKFPPDHGLGRRGLCRTAGAEYGVLTGGGAARWLWTGPFGRAGDHREGPAHPDDRGLRVLAVGLGYPRRAAAGAEGADGRRDGLADLPGAGLIGSLQSRCEQRVGPDSADAEVVSR